MRINVSEFIKLGLSQLRANLHLTEPGFTHLYVRFNKRVINGKVYPKVLDLANITVEKPGTGTFTRLIQRLRKDYPWLTLYVENAPDPRFQKRLFLLGFKVHNINPDCFFLEGSEPPEELETRAHA